MAVGHKDAGFAADKYGTPAPLLQGAPGYSNEWTVATTGGTRHQVHDNTNVQFVRFFAIGCDCYYTFGDNAVAAPDVTSLLIPSGAVYDSYLLPGQQYVWALAKSGSGSFRVEIQG